MRHVSYLIPQKCIWNFPDAMDTRGDTRGDNAKWFILYIKVYPNYKSKIFTNHKQARFCPLRKVKSYTEQCLTNRRPLFSET
jgi:hypothetical protein